MKFLKGYIPWNKGTKGLMAPSWAKLHPELTLHGEDHPNYKIGLYSKYKIFDNRLKLLNLRKKEYRHRIGLSKKYITSCNISKTKEYKRLCNQQRKAFFKGGGELTIKTIQLVYEDNIKRFGTLTCYLCLCPVPFKKDHLEHKIPLSRGGTNEYDNLAIACQHCNCCKGNRTDMEYRKITGDQK